MCFGGVPEVVVAIGAVITKIGIAVAGFIAIVAAAAVAGFLLFLGVFSPVLDITFDKKDWSIWGLF